MSSNFKQLKLYLNGCNQSSAYINLVGSLLVSSRDLLQTELFYVALDELDKIPVELFPHIFNFLFERHKHQELPVYYGKFKELIIIRYLVSNNSRICDEDLCNLHEYGQYLYILPHIITFITLDIKPLNIKTTQNNVDILINLMFPDLYNEYLNYKLLEQSPWHLFCDKIDNIDATEIPELC